MINRDKSFFFFFLFLKVEYLFKWQVKTYTLLKYQLSVMGKLLGKCSKLSYKLLLIKYSLATAKATPEKCSNLHYKLHRKSSQLHSHYFFSPSLSFSFLWCLVAWYEEKRQLSIIVTIIIFKGSGIMKTKEMLDILTGIFIVASTCHQTCDCNIK